LKLDIPAGLDWLRVSEKGRAWLDALPGNVDHCVVRWDLNVGEPFPRAYTSLVLPARRRDGSECILKLAYPDRESEHEALALERWNGEGAVRLLERDEAVGATLIERCLPGQPLAERGQSHALEIFCGLVPRLWKPATSPPFRSLAEEAGWWASHLRENWESAGRPFEASLIDTALDALHTLPATQGGQVLLHQDLHPGNVLSAQREPWLVVDPKPLVGEREFALAPIIRSAELGHGRRAVVERLDVLTARLALDRDRARLWCIAQTVAWSFGSELLPRHVETATWLMSA
jgi:streptomycin 6-kinase